MSESMDPMDPDVDVIDDDEHRDDTQEDIGDLDDLDGDGVPDDLDVGDLDDLVAAVSPDLKGDDE